MIGARKKPANWGEGVASAVPMGIADAAPIAAPAPDMSGMMGAIPRVKPKFNWGQFASDFLVNYSAAQGSPLGMSLLQNRARQQDWEQEDRRAQARRAAALEDWKAQQIWKQQNPDPPSPYRFKNNDGDLMQVGPDGTPTVLYDDPTPKIDWIQARDPATGAINLIPKPRSSGGLPQELTDDDWGDVGGAGPGGPRPFP